MLVAARDMAAVGGKLAISSPNREVTEVFDISGFVSVIDLHRSAEDATARLLEE